jgi:hypothetical protein
MTSVDATISALGLENLDELAAGYVLDLTGGGEHEWTLSEESDQQKRRLLVKTQKPLLIIGGLTNKNPAKQLRFLVEQRRCGACAS